MTPVWMISRRGLTAHRLEDQARLGFAIAHALDNSAPAVDGIEPELQSKIDVIVQALAGAKKPLIISGTNSR